MTSLVRPISQVAASLIAHGLLAGTVLFFAAHPMHTQEEVYRVSLAEFSSPAPVAAPPAEPTPPQEVTPPEPPPPPPKEEPKPQPKEQVKPQTKNINTKKSAEKPAESAPPPPPPQRVAEATGPDGPTLSVGGIAAYDLDAVDQKPSISKRVLPEYPKNAKRNNVEGRVDVRIVVDATGHPAHCEIYRANPPDYFERAALAAAKKTRFIPGKVKGKAVNTVVLIPFVFALR